MLLCSIWRLFFARLNDSNSSKDDASVVVSVFTNCAEADLNGAMARAFMQQECFRLDGVVILPTVVDLYAVNNSQAGQGEPASGLRLRSEPVSCKLGDLALGRDVEMMTTVQCRISPEVH